MGERPASGWLGADTTPNSVHIAVRGKNAAGTFSFGALNGGTEDDWAIIGYAKSVSLTPEAAMLEFRAQNARGSIKNVPGDEKVSFEVQASVGTNVAMSLAYGILGDYAEIIRNSGSREAMYVDIIFFYLTDNGYRGTECAYDKAIRLPRALVTPMMGNGTIDGQDREVCAFKVTAEIDPDDGLYEVHPSGVIDATSLLYAGLPTVSPTVEGEGGGLV